MTKTQELMDRLKITVAKTFVPNPPSHLSSTAYLDNDEDALWSFQAACVVPMQGIALSFVTVDKPENYFSVNFPHDAYCFWQASFWVNQYLEAVTLHVRLDQQYESFCFDTHLEPSLLTSWRNFNYYKEHARTWSELLPGGKFREFTSLSEGATNHDGYDGPELDRNY